MNNSGVSIIKFCVCFFIFNLLLLGCGVGDTLKTAVEVLDDAIEKLERQSIGWQAVLENTRDELIENGQTTISNEVSNLLARAISDTGVEARCYTDFLRDRVKEDLIRLRASITGETLELRPVFCSPNPHSIDFALVQAGRLNTIDIAGYNLDVATIKVYLVDNQNQRADVSFALASPTRYLIALNLGSNGVPLSAASTKIIFELPASEEQSVNVIQPIAEEKTYAFTPPPIENLCPERVGGDREFDGHGPDVAASATLIVKENRELWVRLSLHAKETKSDWSEAYQVWERPLWQAPIGSEISAWSPSTPSTAEYRDNNHTEDFPSVRGSTLVSQFEIKGDTSGDDIGNCTRDDVYMNVYFNEIQVKYHE